MDQKWKRPETPTEYDRRMAAPYDFVPMCDADPLCGESMRMGLRCVKCRSVVVILCKIHADVVRHLPITECPDCKAKGMPMALFDALPVKRLL